MTESCRRHATIFNFLDNLIVHVIEVGKTKMAQVDAGTYNTGESRSQAQQALHERNLQTRLEYEAGVISAQVMLSHAACHFSEPTIERELRADPATLRAAAIGAYDRQSEEEGEDDPQPEAQPDVAPNVSGMQSLYYYPQHKVSSSTC